MLAQEGPQGGQEGKAEGGAGHGSSVLLSACSGIDIVARSGNLTKVTARKEQGIFQFSSAFPEELDGSHFAPLPTSSLILSSLPHPSDFLSHDLDMQPMLPLNI